MALTKNDVLGITEQIDRVAQLIEENLEGLAIPEKVAGDFTRRCDFLSDTVEKSAGIKRDKQGRIIGAADWPAENIGVEKSGPEVSEADEPYMNSEFTQQENRELSDLQESGKMPAVQTEERNPTPGKQALDIDASLRKLSKMAAGSDIHALGEYATNMKICAAKLKNSGVSGVSGLASKINGIVSTLEGLQDRMISAATDSGSDVLVGDEADRAASAVAEILPYVESLADSLQGVKAGSSPVSQLHAEEFISQSSDKLGRLLDIAGRIVKDADSKAAKFLKMDEDED